jgi:hypothetical protein
MREKLPKNAAMPAGAARAMPQIPAEKQRFKSA